MRPDRERLGLLLALGVVVLTGLAVLAGPGQGTTPPAAAAAAPTPALAAGEDQHGGGDHHGDQAGGGHGDPGGGVVHGDAAAGSAHADAHGDGHGREIAPPLQPQPVAVGTWPPALILVLGALVLPVVPGRVLRGLLAIALPASALYVIWGLPDGARLVVPFAGYDLHVLHADRLSLVFGKIFALVGVIAGVYAFHAGDRRQQVAALLYNAGALGVTFAGDYFTLYAFWELMAVSSTILIWARGRQDSQRAGQRYILVHLAGGAVLLFGIFLHVHSSGSILIERFAPGAGGLAAWSILLGFCLNAAVPPLGPWLPDAYPRATVTGAIFCSALTTKTAVYTLLRVFPGWEVLAVAGVVMTLYGVVYAVLANDIRSLLSYHIISQVGYMVAGVGIGTTMALNGAAAHAVCHILYKALLFMGAGAVIQTTGREKVTELGGFWRRQKLILGLYMIGAFSISGFPLWNGFISKSMVVSAAGSVHWDWAFLLLMLASVGTFLSIGLKLPYGTWFGEDRGIRPQRAPMNMIVAMAVAAFLCTLLGLAPGLLYRDLPYAVHWEPYTAPHVIEAVQLLLFTSFAFWVLVPMLHGKNAISVDTDVVYRKSAGWMRAVFVTAVGRGFDASEEAVRGLARWVLGGLENPRRLVPGLRILPGSDRETYDPDAARLPLSVPMSVVLVGFLLVWAVSRCT
jgi:multicomponent Na+:H+ antiporter subunit D